MNPLDLPYRWLRPLLFRLEAERAHRLVLRLLRWCQWWPLPELIRGATAPEDPRLERHLWDLHFPNPVGLAAGLDKDGEVLRALWALGFGFLEAGTVTPLPQEGNPRPRIFRHPRERSLENALGFNNQGLESLRRCLQRRRHPPVPLGINLGANRQTPPESAVADYAALFAGLDGVADYFVINVSSPNTPGLRDLQGEAPLRALVRAREGRTRRPVLVKLSPDLEPAAAVAAARAALDEGAAGVVVTNTTTDYRLLPGARRVGGLSGSVLAERSFELLRALAPALPRGAVLVSVGGVDSGAEVYRRLRAGASLVELYTALVYEGPGLVRRILEELLELMERDGVASVADLG